MSTQLMPRRFCEANLVVLCSFHDIRERQRTFGIRHTDDLIESGNRVTHMFCVRKWFFPLFGKGIDTVGQVAPHRQLSVFFVRLPGGFGNVIRHTLSILMIRCDDAITPEVLLQNNWTLVSATPLVSNAVKYQELWRYDRADRDRNSLEDQG